MALGTRNEFIILDNLWKQFQEGNKKREVLRGTGAAFQRGEFIAILGKSGSGKSTLLNVISGIDEPDQGDIKINGQLLTQLDEYQRTIFRRQKIGFVFQFFNLIPTLTVLENVSLPLELVGAEMKEAVERSSAMLAEVGLSDRLNTFPERLSGGEQQRVAIARALVHDPLVVLADEPTGNLDEDTGEQVLNLLDKLTRQAGKNLIMVTHSNENAIYADRLFELHAGCLVELEKH
ncbi:MAG: ABC transporter ATP-binding protein [Chloroflexota bacterium]|jgi:putative ABC transport system ATP-binding protein|nr:MAG: ABC transporter ATP-binding protein [Chloroflexota bacterium]UCF26992.1 MAG: ABC transporter ATP-binding protein [Chloroflexota bacterium]